MANAIRRVTTERVGGVTVSLCCAELQPLTDGGAAFG